MNLSVSSALGVALLIAAFAVNACAPRIAQKLFNGRVELVRISALLLGCMGALTAILL